MNVDKTRVDSLSLESLDRLSRLINHKTRRDNSNVVTLVESDSLAKLELIGFGVVEAVYSQSAETNVYGSVELESRLCSLHHLIMVGRVENRHTRESTHKGDILEALVSSAVLAC